jgi:hypothetical protein
VWRPRECVAVRVDIGAGRPGMQEGLSVCDGPAFPGGRYWVRTSDLFGVNEALSH